MRYEADGREMFVPHMASIGGVTLAELGVRLERIEAMLARLIEALAEDEETEISLDGQVESRSRQEGEPL